LFKNVPNLQNAIKGRFQALITTKGGHNNTIKARSSNMKGSSSINHKFIGFMGSFQIHAKFVISWVCIIYTQMSCII
jgi:hypothetical protein